MDKERTMTKFWKKVNKCEHKNLSPDYCVMISCSTPYCHGGAEVHCLDCGAYITECPCGANDGMSGWSEERHKNYVKKRSKRINQNLGYVNAIKRTY